MRHRMTIISLISSFALAALGLNTAHAICMPDDTQCPPSRPPPKRTCADPAPTVADQFTVQCKAADGSRCASTIDTNLCHELNEEAFGEGVIDSGAFTWLQNNGKCAIAYVDGMGYHLEGVCRPGCFAETTQILTSSQGGLAGTPAGRITSESRLMALADKASLDRVDLIPHKIDVPTHGAEKPDLFVFSLSNGNKLRVTNAHPMVLADGSVIRADRVKPHTYFVGNNGGPVAVLAITREPAVGEVYGFETNSETRMGHIIVAEGVLVGDLKIQDELQAELTGLEARR